MKRLVPVLLASLALCGCHMFSKKNPNKLNPAVATDVEKDFMSRWIEKRTSELVAQGTDAGTARAQATAEFDEKFSQTHPALQAGH